MVALEYVGTDRYSSQKARQTTWLSPRPFEMSPSERLGRKRSHKGNWMRLARSDTLAGPTRRGDARSVDGTWA